MGLLFREHPKAQPGEGFFGEARDQGFTPLIEFFGTCTMFKILIQPDVDTSYLSKILLLYGAKINKTLV